MFRQIAAIPMGHSFKNIYVFNAGKWVTNVTKVWKKEQKDLQIPLDILMIWQ